MRGRGLWSWAALALVGLAALTGCGGEDTPAWHSLTWRRHALPTPDGDRALVREATWCGDRWYVVGATARGDTTRPAVWTSRDASNWTRVTLDPGGDFYAARAVLSSIACHDGRIAVLGSRSGGAHGNPRVATWRQLADGSLAAVAAPFELYGGIDAVSVHRISGGDGGFLISGTRSSGAAVWSSSDGRRFVLHEQAPGLASTPTAGTQAEDAGWWKGSWLVVGDATLDDGRLTGTAWTGSGDGPWDHATLPGGGGLSIGERVVLTEDGPLVAGVHGPSFGLWEDHDGWALVSGFGRQDPDATEPAFVSGLARTGRLVVATYSDGATFRLAAGPPDDLDDGLPLPTRVDSTGDHTVTVAAHGDDLLLLTDDGRQGRLWTAGI